MLCSLFETDYADFKEIIHNCLDSIIRIFKLQVLGLHVVIPSPSSLFLSLHQLVSCLFVFVSDAHTEECLLSFIH